MTAGQTQLTQVVDHIQQRWGVKALRRLEQLTVDQTGFTTGYAALDGLLGRYGIPRGTLTCLSGRGTSGITTLALDVIVQAQTAGEVTVYIDADRTLDAEYTAQRGVDLKWLLVIRPQPRELGLSMAHDIVMGGGAGVVVFDPGCHPHAWPPTVARMVQRLANVLPKTAYALLYLSPAAPDYLSATTTAQAGVYLRVERRRWLMESGQVSGYEVCVTALKHKYAAPGQRVTFDIPLNSARQGP